MHVSALGWFCGPRLAQAGDFFFEDGGRRLYQHRAIGEYDGGNDLVAAVELDDQITGTFIFFDVDFGVGDLLLIENPLGSATIGAPGGAIHHNSVAHVNS